MFLTVSGSLMHCNSSFVIRSNLVYYTDGVCNSGLNVSVTSKM